MGHKKIVLILLGIGIVLSLISLGIGQTLKYEAVKKIPEKLKDCSLVFKGSIEERMALINTDEGFRISMAQIGCDSYNDRIREEPNRTEETSITV